MQDNIIMFDIGAVLLELKYDRLKARLLEHDPSGKIIRQYAQLELTDLLGGIPRGSFTKEVKRLIDKQDASDSYIASLVGSGWGNPINDMIMLKDDLAKREYTVGLISNIGIYSHDLLSKKYPEIFETFGGPRIFSYAVGHIKPDEEIFARLKGSYSKIVFIDDKESYLASAAKFGWEGIHFTPYIDKSEMIKNFSGHGSGSEQKKGIIHADDFGGVIRALQYKGIIL